MRLIDFGPFARHKFGIFAVLFTLAICWGLALAPVTPARAGQPDGVQAPAATALPKLTADELTILDNVAKIKNQADQDVQTARLFAEAAQAKYDRAVLYEENQKLKLLIARKLSPDDYAVEQQQVQRNGQTVLEWVLVARTRPPK